MHDGGINVAFAHAASDDLRVLRSKIQNNDLFVHESKTEAHSLPVNEQFGEKKLRRFADNDFALNFIGLQF